MISGGSGNEREVLIRLKTVLDRSGRQGYSDAAKEAKSIQDTHAKAAGNGTAAKEREARKQAVIAQREEREELARAQRMAQAKERYVQESYRRQQSAREEMERKNARAQAEQNKRTVDILRQQEKEATQAERAQTRADRTAWAQHMRFERAQRGIVGGVRQAGGGIMGMGFGLMGMMASSEGDTEKMLRQTMKIVFGFELLRGAVHTIDGLHKAWIGYEKAVRAAAMAHAALTAASGGSAVAGAAGAAAGGGGRLGVMAGAAAGGGGRLGMMTGAGALGFSTTAMLLAATAIAPSALVLSLPRTKNPLTGEDNDHMTSFAEYGMRKPLLESPWSNFTQRVARGWVRTSSLVSDGDLGDDYFEAARSNMRTRAKMTSREAHQALRARMAALGDVSTRDVLRRYQDQQMLSEPLALREAAPERALQRAFRINPLEELTFAQRMAQIQGAGSASEDIYRLQSARGNTASEENASMRRTLRAEAESLNSSPERRKHLLEQERDLVGEKAKIDQENGRAAVDNELRRLQIMERQRDMHLERARDIRDVEVGLATAHPSRLSQAVRARGKAEKGQDITRMELQALGMLGDEKSQRLYREAGVRMFERGSDTIGYRKEMAEERRRHEAAGKAGVAATAEQEKKIGVMESDVANKLLERLRPLTAEIARLLKDTEIEIVATMTHAPAAQNKGVNAENN